MEPNLPPEGKIDRTEPMESNLLNRTSTDKQKEGEPNRTYRIEPPNLTQVQFRLTRCTLLPLVCHFKAKLFFGNAKQRGVYQGRVFCQRFAIIRYPYKIQNPSEPQNTPRNTPQIPLKNRNTQKIRKTCENHPIIHIYMPTSRTTGRKLAKNRLNNGTRAR